MTEWTSRSAKGAANELTACAHLLRRGWHVFRSESPACPFDLAAYRAGEFIRVEVKSLNWPGPGYGPTLTWPRNDEWDLLIVVCDDGECIELTEHRREEAVSILRSRLGWEPPPRRAKRGSARAAFLTTTWGAS